MKHFYTNDEGAAATAPFDLFIK